MKPVRAVLVAGALSYSNWRAISHQTEILEATAIDRREFLALLGVFVSFTLENPSFRPKQLTALS